MVTWMLPGFARKAHGILAYQNRIVGSLHGAKTDTAAAKPVATKVSAAETHMQKNNCVACHAIDRRVVGPSFVEIAGKHAGKADYIAAKIKSGGTGVWGTIPMPPQTLSDADARQIADWLAAGAKN
jgi:cytochrome c